MDTTYLSFPEELDDLVLQLSTTPPTMFQHIEVMERRIQMRETLHAWLEETPKQETTSPDTTPVEPISTA